MEQKASAALAAIEAFFSQDLAHALARPADAEVLDVLRALVAGAARDVPAYRARLAHEPRLEALADFARLPLLGKQDYVLATPLAARCAGGSLAGALTVAVSSGSTRQPVLWPRALVHELAVATRFEHVLVDAFRADERRTLAVVGFALGNWVGGMYTTQCLRWLAHKGYPLTVVTPGNDKREIVRVVHELGGAFDQVVLFGYPPFVKDVLDAGRAHDVDWAARQTKLVFAGEVFSETWRDLVCARVGAADACRATASLYGTADGGVLGNETPVSIAIRRFVSARPELARELFGEARLPTLVQYDPRQRYFEVHEGTLVVSGAGVVPLVRYHIADRGGLFGYDELLQRMVRAGFDPAGTAPARELPFVFVFGRADFTISFYGANIYPENVSPALETPESAHLCSGKFVMQVSEDAGGEHVFDLAVELLPGAAPSAALRTQIAIAVAAELARVNSEYAHYVPPERQIPRVHLEAHGDPAWFPSGVKHRYSRRA